MFNIWIVESKIRICKKTRGLYKSLFLLNNDFSLLVSSKLYLSTLMKNNGKFLINSFPYPELPGRGSEGMISACIFGTPLIMQMYDKNLMKQKKPVRNRLIFFKCYLEISFLNQLLKHL